jgi:U3 small nucleolar RNA-associated protein 12
MVKAYLRYEPTHTFGIVTSYAGNSVFDRSSKLAVAAALEDVLIWDVKKGELVRPLANA